MTVSNRILASGLAVALLGLSGYASAVVVGSFAARFDNALRGGGVVAEGASLSGREDGVANATATITIAGIPAGTTVQRALLYWAISGGSDTTATINAVPVTGAQILAVGSTCWGVNNSTFRADVTARVTGNGAYTIGGLPSSTVTTSADTDGVALVVVYQNPTSGSVRRVMIRDGAISTDGAGDVVTDTFTGVAAPFASTGRFHIVVGDGSAFTDGNLTFNGVVIGTDQFPGSDGANWDVKSYNVSVPAATVNLNWNHNTVGDCLLFETAVLDFNVATCGDGLITTGETCDDFGATGGDGCNAQCAVESGWQCNGQPSVCVLTAPTATNLSAAETYIEDTPLDLIDIVASDANSPSLTATLTLSLPAAGSLTTATAGSVTSTYSAGTGVWSANGAIADVNTLLAGVAFVPTANYNASFTIATRVSDGVEFVTGDKAMTGTPVNDAPTLNAIPDPAPIPVSSGMRTVNLFGIGAGPGDPPQALGVMAVSSDVGLIPNPTVNYVSPDTSGSLSYTPTPTLEGSVMITVTVTDNGGSASGGVNFTQRNFIQVIDSDLIFINGFD